MLRLVDIAFTLPLNETYTYEVPHEFELLQGQRVLVPFRNRTLTGFVFSDVRQESKKAQATFAYKKIHALLDQRALLNAEQIELIRHMSHFYAASLGECLNTVLPPGMIKQSKRKIKRLSDQAQHPDERLNKVWQNLFGRDDLDFAHFIRKHAGSSSVLFKLEQLGWLRIETQLQEARAKEHLETFYSLSKSVHTLVSKGKNQKKLLDLFKDNSLVLSKSDLARTDIKLCGTARDLVKKGVLQQHHDLKNLVEHDVFMHAPKHELNHEQRIAVDTVNEAIIQGQNKQFLLFGPTGSGKTEVYLNCARAAIAQGKSVLALVPEISLTPQFIGRFRARFGENVAVLHSALNDSERLTQWQRIVHGQAQVVIGARSAVFSPLNNIGLIILDEEHDSSYKQHEGLKYHTKYLALLRAEKHQAPIVFGSATPSMESFFQAQEGQLQCLTLSNRAILNSQMADTQIINIKDEFKQFGEKGLLSETLKTALQETLANGQQSVVFLNRRGFAPIILCTACGESQKCQHCSVALTYHQSNQSYECHYCGFAMAKQSRCTHCAHGKVIHLGLGTEAVEQELKRYFPDANIARMDRDVLKKKNAHSQILQQLAHGQIDILVGTQMVSKGLDFENVTLVGVLLADQALHFPDFRAAETTFQLLTQVIGRSGRGQYKGKALIQTYQPEHYAIKHAQAQDYQAFYQEEIHFRKELAYPPFEHMVLFRLHSKDEQLLKQTAQWLGKQAAQWKLSLNASLMILGPAPSPLKKIKDVYRYQLMLKGKSSTRLNQFALNLFQAANTAIDQKRINIILDIDPYHFL